MDIAANERSQNAKPEIFALPENFDSYDVIFLGYPNWNADLPMALYTFLESVDFITSQKQYEMRIDYGEFF